MAEVSQERVEEAAEAVSQQRIEQWEAVAVSQQWVEEAVVAACNWIAVEEEAGVISHNGCQQRRELVQSRRHADVEAVVVAVSRSERRSLTFSFVEEVVVEVEAVVEVAVSSMAAVAEPLGFLLSNHQLLRPTLVPCAMPRPRT